MGMIGDIYQGDILKIENIRGYVLVVSGEVYNSDGRIIGCPIVDKAKIGPYHVRVSTEDGINGFVLCENLSVIDLAARGYSKKGRIRLIEIMEISDRLQGFFDYM